MNPNHPLADLLPPMADQEYSDLLESINRNGLRRPIVMIGNQVLTGRHRMKACKQLGIQPQIRQYDPQKDGPLPVEFVLDEEINRRHMGLDQRAVFAAKLRAWQEEKEDDLNPIAAKTPPAEPVTELEILIGATKAETQKTLREAIATLMELPTDDRVIKAIKVMAQPQPGATIHYDGAKSAVIRFVDGTAAAKPALTANEEDGFGSDSTAAVTASEQQLMDKLKVGRNKLRQACRIQKGDPDLLDQVADGTLTLDEAEETLNRRAGATSYRKEAAEQLSAEYGDEIADRVRNCELLYPDKDLKAFMSLGPVVGHEILDTVEGTKWTARQAIQFHSAAFGGADRLADVLEWAEWERGRTGKKRAYFTLAGHKITIETTAP